MENLALSRRDDALILHQEIINSGENAARALAAFCDCLKKMRDTALYKELGCEDFATYCEEKAGIKSRMAYNYISAYERLGEKYITEHASLGITKLEVLSRIEPEKRDDIDAEETSVAELKRLQKELEDKQLEIAVLSGERDELKDKYEEAISELENSNESESEALEAAEAKIAQLEADIKAAEKAKAEKPQPSADDLAKIKKELRKELKDEYEKKAEKDKQTASADAQKAQAEIDKANERLKKLSAEKQAAKAEAARLEKALKASDGAISTVKVYFNEVQDIFGKMLNAINCTEGETKEKLLNAAGKLLDACTERLKESK